jgi:hypothetical protein
MKALKFIFIAILSLTLFTACEKTVDDSILTEDLTTVSEDSENLNAGFRGKRSIPFKAKFYTIKRDLDEGDDNCLLGIYEPVTCDAAGDYPGFNLQCGEGTGTHLGHFTTTMSFCGGGLDYVDARGVFLAANGDELYFMLPPETVGHVLPYDHPVYELQFHDPFIFTGGTGRFEGASGEGTMESYVNIADEGGYITAHQTDHKWTGTLILP